MLKTIQDLIEEHGQLVTAYQTEVKRVEHLWNTKDISADHMRDIRILHKKIEEFLATEVVLQPINSHEVALASLTEEQVKALKLALTRHGKERVLKLRETYEYTIDEWTCDLRPLNGISLEIFTQAANALFATNECRN